MTTQDDRTRLLAQALHEKWEDPDCRDMCMDEAVAILATPSGRLLLDGPGEDVYRERAALVATLARLWPSSLEEADPSPGFRFVVYIDAPGGQVSWHIADADLDLFDGVARDEGRTWDGHDTDEKYRRLAQPPAPTAREQRLEAVLLQLITDMEAILPWVRAGDVMVYTHGGTYDGPEGGIPAALDKARAALKDDR